VNLADIVRRSADRYPARPALQFHGRVTSHELLDDRVDRTAAALAGLGVSKGDRVALLAGNVPEFASSFFGILRAGAVACPLNVMLTPEELSYILADAGAKVAVTGLATLPGLLSIRDRLGDLETILVMGGPPAPGGTVSLDEALRGEAELPDVEAGGEDLAVIAYTSGTTASPRGAMLSHRNLLANLDQMSAVPGLTQGPEDVVFLALPMFHIYALNVGLGMSIKSGSQAVLVERFDPPEALDLIRRAGATIILGAPPMYTDWLSLAEEGVGGEPQPLPSVRLAVSGAAALAPEVFQGFRERFGVSIWEGYGLTEAAPSVTSSAVGPEPKPASIGLPLPGIDTRLVDESGEDVEEGDPGEIWVRGPNVFGGYWGRPDATELILEDGWLKTGDVGYRDEDGYLYLVDRKKDLIIVSGFNVYPREVEEAIAKHPKVAEAAVIGIPDPRTGEAVQAWVVPVEGETIDLDQLLDFLHGYLARFKWPKEILLAEELPHHITGKVFRRMLRTEVRVAHPGEELLRGEAPATATAEPVEGEPVE
jgi:long-chain acyl-CoA synthetase